MIRTHKFIFIGCILTCSGCSEQDDPVASKVKGLENIAYEALGIGKLIFSHYNTVYVVDTKTQTSWGLQGFQSPMISPDGKHIVYQSPPTFNSPSQIWVHDIQSEKNKEISDLPTDCYNPSWTVDSRNILFEVYGAEIKGFYKQSIEENVRLPVLMYRYTDFIESKISVSINDKLVFSFRKYQDLTGEEMRGVFTMNPGGTNLTQIVIDTVQYVHSSSPVWSPDGKRIAYIKSEYPDLNYQNTMIVLMDEDGTNPKMLAKFLAKGNHPVIFGTDPSITWSPDGSKLAFNRYEEDGIHIYVINIDGSGLVKVTSKSGSDYGNLSWSR